MIRNAPGGDNTYSACTREATFNMSDSSIMIIKNLFCGGVAGTTACIIGQPLDLIKIRLQTEPHRYSSAYSCFIQTVRHGGYQGFYKGMTAPLCSQFLQSGLMFTGESVALKFLQGSANLNTGNTSTTAMNVIISGSFGGLIKCIVLVPTDLIKCKMQVDQAGSGRKAKYSGTLDCLRKVYMAEGIRGLFKGFGVTTLREVPAFGLYFFVYRYSLNSLNNYFPKGHRRTSKTSVLVGNKAPRPGLTTLIAGGLAGSVAWICIYPFDVIKSHVQVHVNSTNGKKSMSTFEIALKLYREHGLKAFTRGLGVTIARAFPVNAAMLFTHETLKDALEA